MKVVKSENFNIDNNLKTTMIEAGNIIEIRTMMKEMLPHIQKLNSDEYVVLKTGEVNQMNHDNSKRLDNIATLRHTFKALRDLVNAKDTLI